MRVQLDPAGLLDQVDVACRQGRALAMDFAGQQAQRREEHHFARRHIKLRARAYVTA
jgi:hypothetical protein